ncbi:MAG: Calx-beta domain-containing protein [Candidatus Paceibacterota bacterium]
MTAAFLDGQSSGLPFSSLADFTLEDIAEKIAPEDAVIDFTRPTVIREILRGSSIRTGIKLNDAELTAAAEAIAAVNQQIAQIPVEGSREYLDAVVKVQQVAHGDFADLLTRFGRGEVSTSDLQAAVDNLGAALANAQAFNVLPVYLAATDATVIEGDAGTQYLKFAVTPFGESRVPVSVSYHTQAATAAAGEDFQSASGTLTWAVGDVAPKYVQIPVLGDSKIESDETLTLILDQAENATIAYGTATGTIINDDHYRFVSSSDEDQSIVVSATDRGLIVETDGSIVFKESYSQGGQITVEGQAADELTFFGRGSQQLHHLGIDGSRTVRSSGQTVHVTGVGQLNGDLGIHFTGIPNAMFEGWPVQFGVSGIPRSLNPDTFTYEWTVFSGDDSESVGLGDASSALYVPDQQHAILELRMTDGVGTYLLRQEIFVYPPNVAPIAVDDIASTNENSRKTVDVIANDYDLNPVETLSLVESSVSVRSMQIGTDGPIIVPASSSIAVSGNTITFDPGTDFDFLAEGEFATVLIDYTVTDDNIAPLTDDGLLTLTVTGVNDAPVVSADDAAVTVDEGQTAEISGTFSDVDLTDDVTITASIGSITQVAGNTGSWSWSFNTTDGPIESQTVTITADDGNGGQATAYFGLTVDNVAPEFTSVSTSAPHGSDVAEPDDVTITADFIDEGVLDTHTAMIDWGDGSSSAASIDQGAGSGTLTATHAYATGGVYLVTIALVDDDGDSAVESTVAVISGSGIVDGVLYVIGTSRDDHVHINGFGRNNVRVHTDFFADGPHRNYSRNDFGQIAVYLYGGDDRLTTAGNVTTPLLARGGDGDDRIHLAGGPAVMLGGAGDDDIKGGAGRNVLIGGLGSNTLRAGRGGDLLVGGSTNLDDDDAGLLDLLELWNGSESFDDRVDEVVDLLAIDHDPLGTNRLHGGASHDLVFADLDDAIKGNRKKMRVV